MSFDSRRTRLARRVAAGLAAACVTMAASAAQAQAPQSPQGQPPGRERPFSGLFGSSRPGDRGQSLTFTGTTSAGWDDNVIADQLGGFPGNNQQVEGAVISAGAGLSYARMGRRTNFAANVNADTRYYPSESSLSGGSYGGGVGLNTGLSRNTRLTLMQNVAYQPFYQFGLFPPFASPDLEPGVPSNIDLSVERRASILSTSGVTLEQTLGQRSSIGFEYGFGLQTFLDDAIDAEGQPVEAGDMRSHSAGVRFRRGLTRYATLVLGYRYRQGSFPSTINARTDGHDIDAGIDYARALSVSRKTMLSFSTGSSIMQQTGQPRRVFITGNVNLTHAFSRSWQGRLAYLRDTGFAGNLGEPLFADSVSVRLSGRLLERLMLDVNGGYLSGQLGLGSAGGNDLSTVTAGASLTYALTELLGLHVGYSYFTYDFSQPVASAPGLPPRFDRNSVRAGLTLWLPLIR